MASYSSPTPSESPSFRWKSSTKGGISSERLDEGARPVRSHDIALMNSNHSQDFVPEYLREKFRGRIQPDLCTIKAVCKAGDNVPHYTFTLNWYGNNVPKDGVCDMLLASKFQRPVSKGTPRDHPEHTRRCDGPCGQMRPSKELRVYGRCDHAICPLCIVNAPTVENVDGSMGCCNPECFAADLAALCPDPRLRHKYFQMIINKRKLDEIMATYQGTGNRNMERLQKALESLSTTSNPADQTSPVSGSSSSKRGLKELLALKVLILEKGPMETICRRRVINEIGSTESLLPTLQWVVGESDTDSELLSASVNKVPRIGPGLPEASTHPYSPQIQGSALKSGISILIQKSNNFRQNLSKSRVFFNRSDDLKNAQLQEIDLNQYGEKKIRSFPTTNGSLNFVVDFTNLINGNSKSPYL